MQPGSPAPALADIRAYLEGAGIARQKWPEHVRSVVDDFPRTASGKVQKFVLRQQLRAEASRA
jgi:non-ribosomal peptide synthetase component E (peptide arylation enzyme)